MLRITAVALSCVFAIAIMWNGIPSMRQDWAWPFASSDATRFLVDSWSGWSPLGMGHAVPYPSGYLIAAALWPLLVVVGPTAALSTFLFCIAALIAFGAQAVIKPSAPNAPMSVGLTAFALFNPWIYAKVVAGHVIMLVAYAGLFWLVSATSRPKQRLGEILGALILVYAQLQFFIISIVVVIFAVQKRVALKVSGIMLIIALPTIFGVVANWGTLSNTPYTLAWEQNQSVHAIDALFLTGYFARYTDPVNLPAHIAGSCVLVLAFFGFLSARNDASSWRTAKYFCGTAILSVAISAGTTGVFGPLVAYGVEHMPFTGVYRELYDLLGFLAVSYVVLAANARARVFGLIAVMGGCAAIACWFMYPVSNWTVPQSTLPRVTVVAPQHTRFALYPAFQPMSFRGLGSGADPDAYSRRNDIEPINQYIAGYPESIALLEYGKNNDSTMLSNLSVSTIILRHDYRTDVPTLKAQVGGFPHIGARQFCAIEHTHYIPELTVSPLPMIGRLSDNIGSGDVFFGDARPLKNDMPGYSVVRAPNRSADPSDDWVDANFAFLERPRAAQGIGGAATFSRSALLRAPRSTYLLVLVDGALYERQRMIARGTKGYIWLRVSKGPALMTLRCEGFCVVAATAEALPNVPQNPRPQPYQGVDFWRPLPWLVQASLPAYAGPTLRYNVKYDAWWRALDGTSVLPHVRLDQAVNGWIVQPSRQARKIVIINEFAAIQAIFEIIGSGVVLLFICSRIRRLILKLRGTCRLRKTRIAIRRYEAQIL